MKKTILLFLLSIATYGQADFPEGISLSGNGPTTSTSKMISQDVNGNLNYLNASTYFMMLTGDQNFSGLKSGTTNGATATTGFSFVNNYNGGVGNAFNAPFQYINNLNGVGLGGQNNGVGILNAWQNTSTGILNNLSSSLGSTGRLQQTSKNSVITGWIDDVGGYHAPYYENTSANKNNALLASGGTLENPAHRTGMYFKGKQIYFFGDSYTLGTGATIPANRWTSILSGLLGATEVNMGVGGTTMEKRVPINYMASPNMVDNVSAIPTKTASIAALFFNYGLNDMGQTATDYNVANFITDYTTVINAAIAKGWLPSQIIIIPPYYIGSAGYAQYATITGNAAPTLQRHLDFIEACRQVSQNFGTMYFDIYQDQKKNDITLFSDNIHPNDAGYRFIAVDVAKYLGSDLLYNESTTGFLHKSNNSDKIINSTVFEDINSNINVGGSLPFISVTGKTLSVNSSTATSQAALQLTGTQSTGSGVLGAVYFNNNSTGSGLINASIYATREGGDNFSDLHFDVRGSGGYRSNAIRVYSSGSSGFGGAPDLGVYGAANFAGNVRTIDAVNNLDAATFQQLNNGLALKSNLAGSNSYTGQNTYTNPSGSGVIVNNGSTTYGLIVNNTAGSALGARFESNTGATANLINFTKNGTITSSFDQNGNYIKVGGTADQLLTAIGGVATILNGSAVLDFPSAAAGTTQDLTIAVTGASLGDVVALGVPFVSVQPNTQYTAFVSATDTVTVRFGNLELVTARDPASGTFKVKVMK